MPLITNRRSVSPAVSNATASFRDVVAKKRCASKSLTATFLTAISKPRKAYLACTAFVYGNDGSHDPQNEDIYAIWPWSRGEVGSKV